MRKSLKIVVVTAVLLAAMGAVVLAYAGSQNSFNVYDEQIQTNMLDMQAFLASNNDTMPHHMRGRSQMRGNDLQGIERLLENATLSTVQGTIVSEFRDMLILDTGAGQIRVLLPKSWSVDSEVVGKAELFNGTFASPGQSVTVKVLESDLSNNASFSISVMLAYEAVNATGAHAYAVLPFNIQPHS